MMIAFALAIVLLLASLVGVTLDKAYFYLPTRELKRRAERGDGIAKVLYRAAVYDGELRFLLAILTIALAAGGIALFAMVAPLVLGIGVTAVTLALAFFWQPRSRLTPIEAQLAQQCTPAVVWLLSKLHPVLAAANGWGQALHLHRSHTGLFERADIDELLERQAKQRDNRVELTELDRLRRVLRAGNYHVKDCFVPMRKVVAIKGGEAISPVLVSELHRTGYTRFPVYEETPDNLIGILELERVADVRQHGLVQDNIDHRLVYLHEADSLEQALRAFYETHRHLFIVLNGKNEAVGVITLSDILKQLMGGLEHLKFGRHDDREAVSARHS